jgi:hypothetical protein
MANVDVTITMDSALADLFAASLAIPDPPDLRAARVTLLDGGTGTAIPIQAVTFPP